MSPLVVPNLHLESSIFFNSRINYLLSTDSMPGTVLGVGEANRKKSGKIGSLPSKSLGSVRGHLQVWGTVIRCSRYDDRDRHRAWRKHRGEHVCLKDQLGLWQKSESWWAEASRLNRYWPESICEERGRQEVMVVVENNEPQSSKVYVQKVTKLFTYCIIHSAYICCVPILCKVGMQQ